jgi:hypothetical protein
MTLLERRYRWLLALYPWSHRRLYEEEMLTVLLEGAAPGQRRPGLREVLNVAVAAASVRLRTAPGALATPTWSAGAAVTGFLASLALLAVALDHEINHTWADPVSASPVFVLVIPGRPASWLPVAGWAAVMLCAVLGRRRPAAGLAWLAAGWEAFAFIQAYRELPILGVGSAWKLVLAVVAASALTIAGTGALALIGGRRMLAIAAVVAVRLATPLVNRLTAPDYAHSAPVTTYVFGGYESTSDWRILAIVALLAASWLALAITLASLAPAIRRRLIAFGLPVAVPVLVDKLTLSGWRASTGNLGHAVPLVPAQWLALFGLPVLVGLAGLAYVQRREHVLRMVSLGRTADLAES